MQNRKDILIFIPLLITPHKKSIQPVDTQSIAVTVPSGTIIQSHDVSSHYFIIRKEQLDPFGDKLLPFTCTIAFPYQKADKQFIQLYHDSKPDQKHPQLWCSPLELQLSLRQTCQLITDSKKTTSNISTKNYLSLEIRVQIALMLSQLKEKG